MVIALCLVLPLSSCASYRIYPESDHVIASWYGPEFHGKPTSSGEVYDMHAFTCAHREYPFGAVLKVTHASNGNTVFCTVNDRGPFVDGRDIDLSYAAAKEIGMLHHGISAVRVEYVGRDASLVRMANFTSGESAFTIQAGSFRELFNAQHRRAVLGLKYSGVYISEVDLNGYTFYRVRIGRFTEKEDAVNFAATLMGEGYEVIVTKIR